MNNIHCFEDYTKLNTTALKNSHRDHTYAKIEVTAPGKAVPDGSKLNFNNNMQSSGFTTLCSLDRNLYINETNDQTAVNQFNVAQVENHPETNSVPGHPNIKLTVSRPSLPTSVPQVNLAGTTENITTFGHLVLIVDPKLPQPENQPFRKRIICCIGSCKSDATNVDKVNGLSFHRFPHDADMAIKWVEIVRRTRGNSFWTPSDDDVVCSKHFRPADMVNLGEDGSCTHTLLDTAIPTERLQSKESSKVEKKQGVRKELCEPEQRTTKQQQKHLQSRESSKVEKQQGVRQVLGEPEQRTTKEQQGLFHEKTGKQREEEINNLRQHYGIVIDKLNKKLRSKQKTITRQRNKLGTLRKQVFRQKNKIKKMEDRLISLKANCENID